MSKKFAVFVLATSMLASVHLADAQQAGKVYRINYLSRPPVHEGFRQRLRDLGYIEGQNLVIEWRSTKGKGGLYPELVAELARLKVDLILAVGRGRSYNA